MFNLIETQQALKGLPLPDVMKYANGKNPEVPAYLALTELQRRKQLEETQSAFNAPKETVKEQIESGLTSLPQGQVNPTQAPQMSNPTATPPQLAMSPTAAPPMMNPTAAPAGVQQGMAPAVPKMAEGGLSQLPLPHMFRQTSYADGGIVHFDGGGMGSDGMVDQSNTGDKAPGYGLTVGNFWDVLSALGGETEWQKADRFKRNKIQYEPPEGFDKQGLPIKKEVKPTPVPAPAPVVEQKVEPTKVPPNPNKQASNTSSGQIEKTPAAPAAPAVPMLNPDQFKAPAELSDQQLLQRRRDLNKLAGVEENPMADIKERYAKLEAKRAAQEEGDPSERLIARLAAFSGAKATEGFGAQLGESAVAGSKMQKEQEALRDKQATEMNALQLNIAKEEDARKRGDVSAVESARAAQEKTKQDLLKLGIDASNATANQINAAANTLSSQAQMLRVRHEASTSKTPAEIQIIERAMKDKGIGFVEAANLLQGIKGSNVLLKDAQAKYDSSMALRMEWEKKGGYPAYLASQGITMPGGGGGGNAPAMAPKEGDKAQSNSGKPIIFKNGKWEYQ